MGYYLMFDVGGTKIKAGILDEKGQLYQELVYTYPALAKESKEIIFKNFAKIIGDLIESLGDENIVIEGIGLAFPGPFDYEKGISQMKGLDKYDEIYGLAIEEEIKKCIQGNLKWKNMIENLRFVFLHDIEAFALGVCKFHLTGRNQRLIHLCIGTGAGSAFTADSEVLKKPTEVVPENGWIYNSPFKGSRIDDYISVRGLSNKAMAYYGEVVDGADLYKRAQNQEVRAQDAFHAFGVEVFEALRPFIEGFKPDGVVLGGQISKSFTYFGQRLQRYCDAFNITIHLEENTSKRIFQGLYTRLQK